MSLVKLENITKRYQNNAMEFYALKGIDFQLNQGEMVALMGASGSGKSTLMNIIGLLDRPSSGKYYYGSADVGLLNDEQMAFARNKKIGFVFQSFFLLPRLSVLQNIMLPLHYRGIEKTIAQKKAKSMLEKMSMENFSWHKPNQLSGGQQQRVAIARALVGEPDLILADEPTGALDSHTGNEILALLKVLHQKENKTILIVTHDQQVSSCCERTVLMQDGKIAGEK